MPCLSFKQMFEPFVLDGSKTHTIRAKRKRAWKLDDTLYLYREQRNPKLCKHLFDAPCAGVEDIVIRPKRNVILVNNDRLDPHEMDLLAWRDGFRRAGKLHAWQEMREYWTNDLHPEVVEFRGDIIHWDYTKRIEGTHEQGTH